MRWPRYLQSWSDTQIIEELARENRKEDIEVWHKFINSGFDALQGGNVQILGEPLTEYCTVCGILREFGRMAPDVWYLTKEQFEQCLI